MLEALQIDSLCMRCHQDGTTMIHSVDIPFYRRTILASFLCPHCGYRNSNVQSAEPVQEFGVEIFLRVHAHRDLNRTVVRSEYATVEVPELELSVPPSPGGQGDISTVEGVILAVRDDVLAAVQQEQIADRHEDVEQQLKTEITGPSSSVLSSSIPPALSAAQTRSTFAASSIDASPPYSPTIVKPAATAPPPNSCKNGPSDMRVLTVDDDHSQQSSRVLKLSEFIDRLNAVLSLKNGYHSWTFKLRDPSGNSIVQNLDPLHPDPHCVISRFVRNRAENQMVGLLPDDEDVRNDADDDSCCHNAMNGEQGTKNGDGLSSKSTKHENGSISKHAELVRNGPGPVDDTQEIISTLCDGDNEGPTEPGTGEEVLRFIGQCPACAAPGAETRMKPTVIPQFQTVIIMSTDCDRCGFKSNEVKSGATAQTQGCLLSLLIESAEDLSRDVLKSDTCMLQIPELELEIGPGLLAGRFTTVEGLLSATRDQMGQQLAFFVGDSAAPSSSPASSIPTSITATDGPFLSPSTFVPLTLQQPSQTPSQVFNRVLASIDAILAIREINNCVHIDQQQNLEGQSNGESGSQKNGNATVPSNDGSHSCCCSQSRIICTLVLDDPAGNSYVQSLATAVDEDPRLNKQFYTRTFEQDEELGLNDMCVDDYYTTNGTDADPDSISTINDMGNGIRRGRRKGKSNKNKNRGAELADTMDPIDEEDLFEEEGDGRNERIDDDE